MDRDDSRTDAAAWSPGGAHLVGLGETGMAGLAQWLLQRGVVVSGSPDGAGPVIDRAGPSSSRPHAGHGHGHGRRSAGRVPASTRLLIHAPAVPAHHPDRLRAARLGVPQASLTAALGRWLRPAVGVAFVGPRAAGLAAAMVGWTLERAGLDPTVILNSAAPQLGGAGRAGRGPHGIVEAAGPVAAARLGPTAAVLLGRPAGAGPEGDGAVRRLADTLPPAGFLLAAGRSAGLRRALAGRGAAVEWFGLRRRGACWWGADLREDRGRYRFRAFRRGRFVVEVRLAVPGREAVTAALAAVAACTRLGVGAAAIKDGLEEFAGVARHLEPRGSYRGATLIDDRAGTGRAVARALVACRQAFGRRRLVAAFGPGPGPCSPAAAGRLAAALGRADRAWIVGGPPGLGPAVVGARRVADGAAAIRELGQFLEPGDVLVTLGAGDVGVVADAFSRRLPGDRPGR